MDLPAVSRRGFVAGVTVALAGCVDDASESPAESDQQTDTERAGTADSSESERTDTTETDETSDDSETADADDSLTVDWDEVSEFRTWLTDYSTLPTSNNRFDYHRGYAESFVAGGRIAFLELSPESVTGHLTQSRTAIHLGTFEKESLTDRIEASDEYERTDEYEGYAIAESAETKTELAVGDDAVLAGSDVTEWIDARRGNRDRLETVDPEFTRLFRRLPDRGIVTGQHGAPVGGEVEIENVRLWGHSMESLEAETGTWVYIFESEDALTDSALADLETRLERVTEEITDVEADGRVATITAIPMQLG